MSTVNASTTEVKLPKAVQMQMARVKELEAANVQPTPSVVTEVPPTPPKKDEVVSTVSAAPAVPEVPKDGKYWEHRFKTAQGMYEADKTKLKSHIVNLESRLSDIESEVKRRETTPSNKTPDLKKYLSAEEIDAHGTEALNVIVRTATQAAEEVSDRKITDEYNRKIKPIQEELSHTREQLRSRLEEKFWETIDEKVTGWGSINDDPRFHEWLTQKDSFSGIKRQDLLASAQQALDSDRVVAMFNGFLQNSPAPKTLDITRQVVPEPIADPAAVNGTPDAPIVLKKDISRFYTDKALGKYRNRPQEAEAFEKKIRMAEKAGTIR